MGQKEFIMEKLDLNQKIFENLNLLKGREQEILISRFGLTNEANKTLQAIGRKYGITRERVRQIINFSFKKLKRIKNLEFEKLAHKIEKIIDSQGGLIAENQLASQIFPNAATKQVGAVEIICRINPNLIKIKKTPQTEAFWTTGKIKLAKLLKINKTLIELLNEAKKTQIIENLAKLYFTKTKLNLSPTIIKSIASGSNKLILCPNNTIGLSFWPEINPKNTRDKIFYVLNHAQKPLHFIEITQQISNKKFSTKNPTQTTVHNELISDDRFVLIGRGIYALKKWGYEPGTVFDLIRKILKNKPKGLTQEQICEQILQKRIISKNTILMNLNSHQEFIKNKTGRWQIARK